MDEFDKIARRAEEERRKLERRLKEVEWFAHENSYAAAAHLYVEALYWRRVWRRRFHKLVKRFGGGTIARNGKVLMINANPRWPREGFSFLCAGAEFSRWENIFGAMLEAGVAAEAVGKDPHLAVAREFTADQRIVADLLAAAVRPVSLLGRPRPKRGCRCSGGAARAFPSACSICSQAAQAKGGAPEERANKIESSLPDGPGYCGAAPLRIRSALRR
jgi:hypothetical protein